MDPEAHLDLRFLSGAPFEADFRGATSVSEVRFEIGIRLVVTPERIKLISAAGESAQDTEPIDALRSGVVTICVVSDPEDEALRGRLAEIVGADGFGSLGELSALHLKRCRLGALPSSFGQLVALRKLQLQDNHLVALPERFGQLLCLRALRLDYNELQALPEGFGELRALESLRLDHNHLTALPESFGQLAALQSLHLNRNHLEAMPASFGQLTALRLLWLHDNELRSLPDGFGRLAALRTLYLQDNFLSLLPEGFEALVELEVLRLDNNELSELPEHFGRLAKLQRLHLNQNHLTALPDGFGELAALKTLWLHDNWLSALPESCSKRLLSIEMLWLQDVQLLSLLQAREAEIKRRWRRNILRTGVVAVMVALLLLGLRRRRLRGAFQLLELPGELRHPFWMAARGCKSGRTRGAGQTRSSAPDGDCRYCDNVAMKHQPGSCQ